MKNFEKKKKEKSKKIKEDKNNFDENKIIPLENVLPDNISDMEEKSIALLDAAVKEKESLDEYYNRILNEPKTEEFESEVKEKIASIKRVKSNMMKAYFKLFGSADELSSRYRETKRKHHKFIPSLPANALIDYKEKTNKHFASGLNFYKMFLICFMGSFVGVVVELIWCLLKNGYLESRAGMVYGPFNPLYGFGALALTSALYKFRNRNGWISFFGGFFVGSFAEYFCSWGQEFVLGSRSWDYSNVPFNINGRICLLYSVFWGILGYFWIKCIYPAVSMLILKIPDRAGKIITWLLFAFFVFDAVVSLIAMFRWSQRLSGVAASNWFWEFIDMRFTNERMSKIYANMNFGN